MQLIRKVRLVCNMATQSKSSLEKEGEEEEEEDDSIEGTVFSKSWVLSLLAKLVRAVEEGPSENGGEEEKERECELDEALENELCLLWDLTVNKVRNNYYSCDNNYSVEIGNCIIFGRPQLGSVINWLYYQIKICQTYGTRERGKEGEESEIILM